MVTTPYEWKILEWDEKPQTNKLTKNYGENYGTSPKTIQLWLTRGKTHTYLEKKLWN